MKLVSQLLMMGLYKYFVLTFLFIFDKFMKNNFSLDPTLLAICIIF